MQERKERNNKEIRLVELVLKKELVSIDPIFHLFFSFFFDHQKSSVEFRLLKIRGKTIFETHFRRFEVPTKWHYAFSSHPPRSFGSCLSFRGFPPPVQQLKRVELYIYIYISITTTRKKEREEKKKRIR